MEETCARTAAATGKTAQLAGPIQPAISGVTLGSSETRSVQRIGIAAALLLSFWLLWPALTPAHVEGFSAAMAALGLHLTQGTIASFDQLEPLNTEYFGLTKFGMVASIGGVSKMLHVPVDLAQRLIMWAGLVMLLASSATLIRRWSGAGWTATLAPLVIMPGVFESSFIFCDNVLAAGLAACALCLLYHRSLVSAAIGGALFGFAVLTRTDIVLVAVAIPIILVERLRFTRRLLGTLVIFGVASAIASIGVLALFGATPLDVVRVGLKAVSAWDRPTTAGISLVITLFFLSLGGVALVGLGILQVLRERHILPALRLLLPPSIVFVVMRESLWETRQLLALTPFLGTLAAIALRNSWETGDARNQRLTRTATSALIAFSLIGPVAGSGFADGPRALIGRVWNIPTVRAWQAGSRDDVSALDGLIARSSQEPFTALLADGWDEDRYLHMALLDRGYNLTAREALPADCRNAADHYQRGPVHVVVIRGYQSFVPYGQGFMAQRFSQRSLPCIIALGNVPTALVTTIKFIDKLPPAVFAKAATNPLLDDPRSKANIHELSFRQLGSLASDDAAQSLLLANYQAEVRGYKVRIGPDRERKWSSKTMADAFAATRSQTAFPGSR